MMLVQMEIVASPLSVFVENFCWLFESGNTVEES
jgi:hypothetical protein